MVADFAMHLVWLTYCKVHKVILISQILIQTANQQKFDSLPWLWPLPLFGGIQGQQQHNLKLQLSDRISWKYSECLIYMVKYII